MRVPPGFGCAGAGRRGGSGQRRAKAHAGSFGSAEEGEFLGAEWRGECWRAHPLIAPLPVAILGTPSVHGGGALRLEKCTFEAQAPLPGASFAAAQAAVVDLAQNHAQNRPVLTFSEANKAGESPADCEMGGPWLTNGVLSFSPFCFCANRLAR